MRRAPSSSERSAKAALVSGSAASASANSRSRSGASGVLVRLVMQVSDVGKASLRWPRNTTNSSRFLFAFPASLDDRTTKRPDFLAKTAQAKPLGGPRRRDSGGCGSGFGQGRRATLHHRKGGREGRCQRRIALSVFPQQGGDPLSAPERRMAADERVAARDPRGRS